MLIFGWGKKTKKDHGATYPLECSNCNNSTFAQLVESKEWFTLFFIPIIPYNAKYFLLCKVCNYGVELKGPAVQRAKTLVLETKAFQANEISDEDYKTKLSEARLFE